MEGFVVLEFRHFGSCVALFALVSGQTNADIVPHVRQPGEVFASCTIVNGDQRENPIWLFYPHNGELWVGGGGPVGRVVQADDKYLVGRIEMDLWPSVYFGHVLIERETSKYFETRILSACENDVCSLKTETFKGKCTLH